MNSIRTILVAIVCISILGCDSGKSEAANLKKDTEIIVEPANVLAVSDYEFLFNEDSGVNITFNTKNIEECTLTFAKASVSKGFTATSEQNPDLFDLSCTNDNGLYVLDGQNTSATINLHELNVDEAVFLLSAKLYAARKKHSLELNDLKLVVRGDLLTLLQRK